MHRDVTTLAVGDRVKMYGHIWVVTDAFIEKHSKESWATLQRVNKDGSIAKHRHPRTGPVVEILNEAEIVSRGSPERNPPYKPPAPGNLPKHGKDMLKNVYTSARERGFDQEAAARQAWCTVKRYYYKRGGKWTKRKDVIPPNEYAPGCGPPTRKKTMAKMNRTANGRKKNQGRHYQDDEWVQFILDGFPESMELEDVDAYITPELQAEVDRFMEAVDRAVEECSKRFPPAEEIIPRDADYYDIYQTLVEAGVGIWDGRWDKYYPGYTQADWDRLSDCYQKKLQRFADVTGGGSLNEAFMDAVYAAEMPEDDAEFKRTKPKNKNLQQLKNKLLK